MIRDGYTRLCSEMILAAVLDLANEKILLLSPGGPSQIASANNWLFREGWGAISLNTCCALLEMSIGTIRRWARQCRAKGILEPLTKEVDLK